MMDLVLEAWVSAIIEAKRASWMMGGGRTWKPGEKLRVLFAGYNGTRNMGSDVRVEEMLRQLRHILGADNVDFSVMTQTFARSEGYFKDTRQVLLPQIFPPFLSNEVPKHHGVVACEGSMFKSKFANALTTMMIGSLGIAAVQNKLSVGYGAEAGHMDPLVARMCARYCKDSLIITRNDESRTLLRELGVPTELGTDTAWTFQPLPAEYGQRVLRDAGWDGSARVLVVCPINPFRVAGESFRGQVSREQGGRGIQGQPLPVGLLSQFRTRGRKKVRELSQRDCQGRGSLSPEAQCVRRDGGD